MHACIFETVIACPDILIGMVEEQELYHEYDKAERTNATLFSTYFVCYTTENTTQTKEYEYACRRNLGGPI